MFRLYLATAFIVVIATLGFITTYTQIDAGTKKRAASHKNLSDVQLNAPLLIYVCALLILASWLDAGMYGWLYWALLNFQAVILIYANLLVPTLLDFIIVQAVGITIFTIAGTLRLTTLPLYLLACLFVYAERWYGLLLQRHRSIYFLPALVVGAMLWLTAWLSQTAEHPLTPQLALANFIAFGWAYFALWNYDSYQRKDQQVIAALTHQVQYDALTRVRNWAMFQHDFNAAYDDDQPVALIAMDLDHFKHINDTYGHLVGNQALMRVAAQLQHYLQESDNTYHLYRTGGEEFAIVLPQTDQAHATTIVRTCQQRVREATVRFSAGEFHLTASFGLAIATPGDANATAVFKRADSYLYQSKHHGRDCITIEGTTEYDEIKNAE